MNYTVVHRTPLDASAFEAHGLVRLPFEEGLFKTTAASSSVESPVIETPDPFDDLVGSWNAALPPGSRLEMQARVLGASGWSGWFTLAEARGPTSPSAGPVWESVERQENEVGLVDVDTLKLKRPATAFRYRLLFSARRGRPVVLRLAAVTVSSSDAPAEPPPFPAGLGAVEIEVPPRSQLEEQEKYKHDICSPTSLSMALSRWGVIKATIDIAERVRDRKTGIFGHWPFNTATAGGYGLEAYVSRLESLEDLRREISQERPVVVSLTFGPGELTGAPLKATRGHLVLVAGFTAAGDVIALDPAAPGKGTVRRVYKRSEFHKAWRVNKRGLAYLIGPLRGRTMTVGVPAADLRAKPRARKRLDLDDALHLSQLLYGETVTVAEVRGDWVRVLADEQPAFRDRSWQGYPGWVEASALHWGEPPAPNVVVRTRQALLQRGADMMLLSVGTRLQRISQDKEVSRVRLVDGTSAEMASDSLTVPPREVSDDSRSRIIKTAELFLGTSYYWGGRSGVQPELSIGVDCSGLVNLCYRVHGLLIPRDSRDQQLRSRPLRSRELKPGDLVFLSEDEKSGAITHLMIYTGGDGVIESRKSSGRVLRSSFKERFGKPITEIESGDVLTDYSFPRPRRRRIFFGTYF